MAETNPTGLMTNAAKMVGEYALMPGVSLAADGDIKGGAMHAAAALGAGIVLGPVLGPLAWIAAGINSYSKSVTGKNVYEHFTPGKK